MMQGRLSVGIIGAGPVGTVLGQALAAAGHFIVGIATTDEKNIERAETLLPDVPVKALPAILEEADLVLLAIPADQIAPTVNGIAQNSMWRSGQLVAHTAGEHGYNILGPATAQGVLTLLHDICKKDRLTAIVSLHQVNLARLFADRIVGMRQQAFDEVHHRMVAEIR